MLEASVVRLLRPLVRILLRHAVPFGAFEVMAKQAYIDVAASDFAIPNKKPSASRVSILTGLTRKDVHRLMNEPADASGVSGERYNRAARVLTGWIRDPDYLDAAGEPKAIAVDGTLGFGALVKRHSGDMPARAVLDELVRAGAVRQRDDGMLEPLARAYVPQRDTVEKLEILGTDTADLIRTIDHNLQHGTTDPLFQRKVMYHSISADALPAFRKLSASQAQALLEKFDRWLADHDTNPPPEKAKPEQARVGIGIYYFEERIDIPSSTGDSK